MEFNQSDSFSRMAASRAIVSVAKLLKDVRGLSLVHDPEWNTPHIGSRCCGPLPASVAHENTASPWSSRSKNQKGSLPDVALATALGTAEGSLAL